MQKLVYTKDKELMTMIYDNIKWCMNRGYWTNRKYGLLHRYIYTEHNGKIPEGYVVHHINSIRTDNAPKNLIAMTKSEHSILHNKGKKASDEAKQRMSIARQGEKSVKAKLTEENVRLIKGCLELGYTHRYLAEMFSVNPSTISNIKRGKTWVIVV